MELKRQEREEQQHQQRLLESGNKPQVASGESTKSEQKPKRVRGRRSSKPQMEKKRRARINECLDILKNYVLNDSSQLIKMGIHINSSPNGGDENKQSVDEESVASKILKSSGLINRHRGRKNPNKLEKADILELTVDYVRRLHEQRDELLLTSGRYQSIQQVGQPSANFRPLDQPLRLNLANGFTSQKQPIHPATPPPSSNSSSPVQPLLSISSNIIQEEQNSSSQRLSLGPILQRQPFGIENSMILDLSESHRKRQPHPAHQQVSPSSSLYSVTTGLSPSGSSSCGSHKSATMIYNNNNLSTDSILIGGPASCWQAWTSSAGQQQANSASYF